jgi:pimeloyl-ACP methyl ester carboxylesterase
MGPSLIFLPVTSRRGSFLDPMRKKNPGVISISLDWPGLRGTPPLSHIRIFDNLVELTIRSINTPSALVSQSMGSYVAIRVALNRPDLATHFVLAVTYAGIDRELLRLTAWRPVAADHHPGSSWVTIQQPSFDERLSTVTVPTLHLWATDDPISPLAIGERLNNLLPDSQLVTYDSDSHWVVLKHAKDVASEIDAVLTAGDQ